MELKQTAELVEGEKKKKLPKAVRVTTNPYTGRKTVVFDYPAFVGQTRTSSDETVQHDELGLRFKIGENCWAYNAVVNAFRGAGFKQTESDLAWNVFWGRHFPSDEYKSLRPFQRINHFPGSWCLGRKDLLAQSIGKAKRRCGPKEYNFTPDTFMWPDDRSLLETRVKAEPDALWIVKPPASSCGRGIRVLSKISEIDPKKKFVVSRYISNPYLLDNGCKFDLRLYIVVTSYDPLRVYLFENGLVRFATKKYSTKKKTLKQRYVHLTNYSVNKRSGQFVKNEEADSDDVGSKWSFIAFKEHLASRGIDVPALLGRIHELVIKTLLSVESTVTSLLLRLGGKRSTCFELMGFDILLDEQLKPWLLEVNIAPSLSSSSPLDKHIKTSLMCDIFHMIGVHATSPKAEEKERDPSLSARAASAVPASIAPVSGVAAARARNFTQLASCRLDEYPLSIDDVDILREAEEEHERRGHFTRVFPAPGALDRHAHLFETPRYCNVLLSKWMDLPREKALRLLTASPSPTGSRPLRVPSASRIRSAAPARPQTGSGSLASRSLSSGLSTPSSTGSGGSGSSSASSSVVSSRTSSRAVLSGRLSPSIAMTDSEADSSSSSPDFTSAGATLSIPAPACATNTPSPSLSAASSAMSLTPALSLSSSSSHPVTTHCSTASAAHPPPIPRSTAASSSSSRLSRSKFAAGAPVPPASAVRPPVGPLMHSHAAAAAAALAGPLMHPEASGVGITGPIHARAGTGTGAGAGAGPQALLASIAAGAPASLRAHVMSRIALVQHHQQQQQQQSLHFTGPAPSVMRTVSTTTTTTAGPVVIRQRKRHP